MLPRAGAGRPLVWAALVTLAWHLVVFAAAFGLPPLAPEDFPDLGATVVNLLAALVPIAVIWRCGWRSRSWLRLSRPRRPLLLLPVLAVDLTYATPGIEGSALALLSSAVLMLAVGLSEELL